MNRHLFLIVLLLTLFSSPSLARHITVLQWNIWQEGTVVPGGYDAVVNEITRLKPDFVTLSEVRNYNGTRFCDRIVNSLREKGETYYSFFSDDSGLLSRTPITDSLTVFPLQNDHGSIYKLVTTIDGQEFAVYTAHLDYLDDAYYNYYDYLNTQKLYEQWTPAHIGKEVFEEKHPSILGGMFAVWNDHAGNGISTKDIHDRTYPAIQTLAVKMWTGAAPTVPYTAFNDQRRRLSEAPGVNQAGRLSGSFSQQEVRPGETLPLREVGYGYTVSFDLDGEREVPGTELFRSPSAVFYLSDPIKGMMGYARDGYLFTFPYSVKKEKVQVKVEGDNRSTRLFINDRLVEEKVIRKQFISPKDSMKLVPTLVFPLEKAGQFKSRITNLNIRQ